MAITATVTAVTKNTDGSYLFTVAYTDGASLNQTNKVPIREVSSADDAIAIIRTVGQAIQVTAFDPTTLVGLTVTI